ncbi:protoglobin domain-containing protein [Pseudomonas sp. LRF_L74]|uniref:protoglobin domain-containing protein n=1 Tax=Pseudomonas sp. LRF_L74 TaxID=3369422 RepID=UPI003F5F5A67
MSASNDLDFTTACLEGKRLVNLTPDDESLIRDLAPLVIPHLDGVTQRFYATLLAVPSSAAMLEGRVEQLSSTHRAWLESLFTRDIDATYTQWMHHIGSVHVRVKLPVEFMTCGMTLILRELIELITGEESLERSVRLRAVQALTSLCGFSQLIMQRSYSSNSLEVELERFLTITGMSRKLFDNLASAF